MKETRFIRTSSFKGRFVTITNKIIIVSYDKLTITLHLNLNSLSVFPICVIGLALIRRYAISRIWTEEEIHEVSIYYLFLVY